MTFDMDKALDNLQKAKENKTERPKAPDRVAIKDGKKKCPGCRKYFTNIANHWRYEPMHRPRLTQRHHDILTGWFMGDANIVRSRGPDSYPYMSINNTNKEFVEWTKDELGIFSGNITSWLKEGRENEMYRFATTSHPGIERYVEWTSSGDKIFPNGLEINSLIGKIWYCCDGTYQQKSNMAKIYSFNESDRVDFLLSLFEEHDIECGWYEDSCSIVFDGENTQRFFRWIGDPIPGMEYKWPDGRVG